jgi:site-specific DNA recombinase
MDRKKLVVAYCRVSTLEQKRRGYGIDIQIRDVTLFAERSGLFILRFYKDEAESGIEEDRTELQRLLKDCRTGRVAKVIVSSLDRLSRDVRLAENLFHEFDEAGVEVLIADMPAYNGRDRKDVLIRQIREAIAEENRKDIIERLKKGREERVRRGLLAGGNLPYGLAREGKEIVLVPKEIRMVRLIFQAADLKLKNIAGALNKREFTRRNGKPWTARQVSAILTRRPFYYDGMIRYGEASGQNRGLAVLGESANNPEGRDAEESGKRNSAAL